MSVPTLSSPLVLPNDPAEARHRLGRFLHDEGWGGDVDGVLLSVHEALSNAHRHGGGPVRVSTWRDGAAVVVEVADEGPGFDPEPHVRAAPQPWAERGRGLWLMGRFASHVEVRVEDSRVCLRLRFDGP